MQEKLIQKYEIILEVFKSYHLQAYENGYWRLSGKKECSEKTTKTACLTKYKYLLTIQVLARRDRKLFVKRSNGKSKYSTIH